MLKYLHNQHSHAPGLFGYFRGRESSDDNLWQAWRVNVAEQGNIDVRRGKNREKSSRTSLKILRRRSSRTSLDRRLVLIALCNSRRRNFHHCYPPFSAVAAANHLEPELLGSILIHSPDLRWTAASPPRRPSKPLSSLSFNSLPHLPLGRRWLPDSSNPPSRTLAAATFNEEDRQ